MRRHDILMTVIAVMIALSMSGCSSDGGDARLAKMAERHEQRQAEQNKQLAQLQQEVATGSRQLVEADAVARRELTALQRELQAQQAQIVEGHDALEEERRQLASQRQRDPIVAAAITNLGLLLACLLPLVVCWYLLRQPPVPFDDQVVSEVLIEDLISREPLLLPPAEVNRQGGLEQESRALDPPAPETDGRDHS